MRFLFECVGCYTLSSQSTPENSSPATHTSLIPAPATEIIRQRKRSSSRAHATDWRPSLFAIAEDNSILATPEIHRNYTAVDKTTANQRSVKRCGPSSARVSSVRSHTRDYHRHEPMAMVIPGFTTPFMF